MKIVEKMSLNLKAYIIACEFYPVYISNKEAFIRDLGRRRWNFAKAAKRAAKAIIAREKTP